MTMTTTTTMGESDMAIVIENLGLLVALLLFALYGLLWRLKKNQMQRREGVNPDVIHKAQKAVQKYFGALEKILPIFLTLILLLHFSLLPYWNLTAPLFGKDSIINELAGLIVGLFGLTLCRIAQVTIGKSWRVGIDVDAKPGLVTNGIYKWIRNPTYSGLYLVCTGVFIAIPSFLLLYWLLAFFISMEFQVRCEEEYLESIYGDEYRDYLKTSKRYLPYLW